jgi:hypothetical protein
MLKYIKILVINVLNHAICKFFNINNALVDIGFGQFFFSDSENIKKIIVSYSYHSTIVISARSILFNVITNNSVNLCPTNCLNNTNTNDILYISNNNSDSNNSIINNIFKIIFDIGILFLYFITIKINNFVIKLSDTNIRIYNISKINESMSIKKIEIGAVANIDRLCVDFDLVKIIDRIITLNIHICFVDIYNINAHTIDLFNVILRFIITNTNNSVCIGLKNNVLFNIIITIDNICYCNIHFNSVKIIIKHNANIIFVCDQILFNGNQSSITDINLQVDVERNKIMFDKKINIIDPDQLHNINYLINFFSTNKFLSSLSSILNKECETEQRLCFEICNVCVYCKYYDILLYINTINHATINNIDIEINIDDNKYKMTIREIKIINLCQIEIFDVYWSDNTVESVLFIDIFSINNYQDVQINIIKASKIITIGKTYYDLISALSSLDICKNTENNNSHNSYFHKFIFTIKHIDIQFDDKLNFVTENFCYSLGDSTLNKTNIKIYFEKNKIGKIIFNAIKNNVDILKIKTKMNRDILNCMSSASSSLNTLTRKTNLNNKKASQSQITKPVNITSVLSEQKVKFFGNITSEPNININVNTFNEYQSDSKKTISHHNIFNKHFVGALDNHIYHNYKKIKKNPCICISFVSLTFTNENDKDFITIGITNISINKNKLKFEKIFIMDHESYDHEWKHIMTSDGQFKIKTNDTNDKYCIKMPKIIVSIDNYCIDNSIINKIKNYFVNIFSKSDPDRETNDLSEEIKINDNITLIINSFVLELNIKNTYNKLDIKHYKMRLPKISSRDKNFSESMVLVLEQWNKCLSNSTVVSVIPNIRIMRDITYNIDPVIKYSKLVYNHSVFGLLKNLITNSY